MAKSEKLLISRIFVALAMLLLLVALIIEILALFSIGGAPFSSVGAFGLFVINETIKFIAVLFVLALLLVTYGMVFVRLRRLSIKPRDLTLILAIVEIILWLIFLPQWVLFAGILMLIAWIVLIV